MKLKKRTVFIALIWVTWLAYLFFEDISAFAISLIFVPVFGPIALYGLKSNNKILQIFSLFTFIAHAIGAPFFWLNRNNYSYSGWGAVKNFSFNLPEFFGVYCWVIALFALIVFFTRYFDQANFYKTRSTEDNLYSAVIISRAQPIISHAKFRNIYNFYILLFILAFAIPLNIYMALNKIGTLGLISEPLPFRLVGIMYYTRLYFIPLILTILYFRSSKSWLIFLAIFAYAATAGIFSSSRSVLILTLMPLLLDMFLSKQKGRGILLAIGGLAAFTLVSTSRDYTYTTDTFSFFDAVNAGIVLLRDSDLSLGDMVGGIVNRFYGAQDMVLAHQFISPTPFEAAVAYFWQGGRADAVIPNLGEDLYGFSFPVDSGFGLGIGTLAYLLILAHSNIILLPIVTMLLAALISFGDRLLSWGLRIMNRILNFNDFALRALHYLLAFVLGLFVYSSTLNMFYLILQLIVVAALVLKISLKSKCRGLLNANNL